MIKKNILIGLLLVSFFIPVGSLHATLIFSEDFSGATSSPPVLSVDPYSEKWDETNYYLGGPLTSPGWTFGPSAYLAEDASTLDKAILLNETGGSMSTEINVLAGTNYILTFDHWGDNRPGNPGYQFTVYIDGVSSGLISRTYTVPGLGATAFIPFTASGNSASFGIVFDESSTREASPIIDNIQINSVVPEPATMLLFGLGLAGLAGVRRKFNQ